MKRPRISDLRTTLTTGVEPQPLPRWWGLAQALFVLGFLVFIGLQFGSSSDNGASSSPFEDSPSEDSPFEAGPVAEEAALEPPRDDDVVVPEVTDIVATDGAVVGVERDAISAARTVAEALFTGDYDAVALAPGVAAPDGQQGVEVERVGDPLIDSPDAVSSNVATLVFPVTLEGSVRSVAVTVVRVDGLWVWEG